MRRFLRFGTLLIACCGCAASGERRVDVTAPRANLALRLAKPDPTGTPASDPREDDNHRHVVLRVFYGTDRARHAESLPDEAYSSQRGPLEFGYCHVSVPADDVSDEEAPGSWRFEFREGTGQTALLGMEPVDRGAFAGELRSDVGESGTGETFVFVHGRDVEFADALRQTARIAHDLRFDGPSILYSWPSEGVADAIADPAAVLQSRSHLAWFLQTVAQESEATRVHLIAHSAGTQLVASVLQEMAESPDGGPRFHEVVLTAADIDAESFTNEIAPRIIRVAERITVYTSDDDPGLLSSARQDGAERVVVPDVSGIDVVDVAARELRFLDSGADDDGSALLGDIRQVFDGVATTQRGLQPHPARQPAWRLPTSDVRFASHAEQLNQTREADVEEKAIAAESKGSLRSRMPGWWPW